MDRDQGEDDATAATEIRRRQWDGIREQRKCRLVTHNDDLAREASSADHLLVGGVDLSSVPGDSVNACAGYVVCSLPDWDVVYEDLQMIELHAPYIPGYLAFREAEPLVRMVQEQRRRRPQVTPHALLVDGNGLLHPHRFGLACHIGVELDLPTVGVAKNLFQMGDAGDLVRDGAHQRQIEALTQAGDSFDLHCPKDGQLLGRAVKTCEKATKPVFVSIGHRVDLATAVELVVRCSKYRIPEPTRQADIRSREYVRNYMEQKGEVQEASVPTERTAED